MRIGIFCLVLGYVLSQFYRAFLAVMAPALEADVGATAEQLADASGLWFLAFAALQLPVGWALDRTGPRRTAAVLLGLCGGGGALVFGLAQAPWQIMAGMALIGAGCAPVLMASLYIFARVFPPAVFGTAAGVIIGVGSIGNLGAALPMAWAVETFGWRESVLALAAITFATAAAILRFVPDPPRAGVSAGAGSFRGILASRAIWLILPLMAVHAAPASGIRGLWVGPYFTDVFGADAAGVGQATLIMAVAMVAGAFAYGPLDRVFRTRKGVVLVGNLLCTAALMALWAAPGSGWWAAAALIAAVGAFGASFPMLMAHGRALFPTHLVGRGVTLLNLFAIGGVGVAQVASGRVHGSVPGGGADAYGLLFGFFGLILLAGCVIYAFAQDRRD